MVEISMKGTWNFWAIVLLTLVLFFKMAWIAHTVSYGWGDEEPVQACYGSDDCEGMCVVKACCGAEELESYVNLSGVCTEDIQWGSCSFVRLEGGKAMSNEDGTYEFMCIDPANRCDTLKNVSFFLRFVSLALSVPVFALAQLIGSKRILKSLKNSRGKAAIIVGLLLAANVALEVFLVLSQLVLGAGC